jgi:hypothetical protein
MHEFRGSCHCGNVSLVYKTAHAPEKTVPRACQCAFCRKHNAAAVSDPEGDLAVTVKEKEKLARYRFGLNTADFLICRACGVYVAAFMPGSDDTHGFATLMTAALDDHARYPAPEPASYASEDADARRARRREKWTPARLQVE